MKNYTEINVSVQGLQGIKNIENLSEKHIEDMAKIFKALGHPTRLKMVDFLRKGESCVCDLQEIIGDDISTISRHLNVLREAKIISSEKRKTFMFYRLELDCLDNFLICLKKYNEK